MGMGLNMAESGYIRGMPDKSYWMSAVRKGIEYRKRMTKEADWNKWRQWYRGEFPAGQMSVNLFFRMLRTTVPRTYFRNPSISITSTRPGDEFAVLAQLVERIDNKLIRTMKMKKALKKMVQHTWMFGTGIGTIGYGGQFSYTPTEGHDELLPNIGSLSERVEYNENVQDNMPWFNAIHPGSFIVPSGLESWEDARWCGQWFTRPLYDVQTDPRLKHTKGLKPTRMNISIGGASADNVDPDMVELVLIRDKKLRKAFIFAPYMGGDKPLLYEDDELQMNGRMGIYPLVFNEDEQTCWGVSDARILVPQQREINEIRTLQMRHRRMEILKIFVKRGMITVDEIDKMTDEEVAAVVQIDGELSEIMFKQIAQEPPDLRLAAQEIIADVRDTLGFSRNQSGEFSQGPAGGGSRASATEANIVNQSSEVRVDERRDMMADVLCDAFEDINDVCFHNWSEEQVVAVQGPDGMPIWVKFKPQMLRGAEYILDIDPDTAQPQTAQYRLQKAIQFYQMAKDNPLVDPEHLTKYLFREFHGVQFDNMMRDLNVMQQGQPGRAPENAIDPAMLMQMREQARLRGPQQ